ncbi:hypothetical protein [Sorangium sp. So ce131]|uniref:hypothetical protein n=1 Tax=Sorangium sp. So ce131 TaxID=3133282 RepID=UPI003F5EB6BC
MAQDPAAAQALFDRGVAHIDAGRYEMGCTALAESQRLDPQPGTLFTLASCEELRGRTATAVVRYGEYLVLFHRMTSAQKAQANQRKRAQVAADARKRLLPRVPRLSLSLSPGAPAGTVVKRDGHVQAVAVLGIALPVDPGEHLVSTQAPGGSVWEQRITLAEGEKKELVLKVNAAPPRVAHESGGPDAGPLPVSGSPAPSAGRRTAVYVAGGVGAAGLVVGGILGALVIGKKGVVDEHCGSSIQASDEKACDATGVDAASSGSSMATVSTIAFGVGLAGLGAATVLYWTEPKHATKTAGMSPRWVGAGVLKAGPAGAVVGAIGSF